MFGIGLPEMIVILAVALIVVGPEKLPDMARSVAKWMFELKKTVNQVKNSLADEENLLGSVQSDLKKTADDLKGNLLESDDRFSWHEPGSPSRAMGEPGSDVLDMDDLKAVDRDRQESTADGQPEDTDEPGAESRSGAPGEGEGQDAEEPPDKPAE